MATKLIVAASIIGAMFSTSLLSPATACSHGRVGGHDGRPKTIARTMELNVVTGVFEADVEVRAAEGESIARGAEEGELRLRPELLYPASELGQEARPVPDLLLPRDTVRGGGLAHIVQQGEVARLQDWQDGADRQLLLRAVGLRGGACGAAGCTCRWPTAWQTPHWCGGAGPAASSEASSLWPAPGHKGLPK